MSKLFLLFLIIPVFTVAQKVDTVFIKQADVYTAKHKVRFMDLMIPAENHLPEKMRNALAFRKKEMDEMVFKIEDYPFKSMLKIIDSEKEYGILDEVDFWAYKYYKELIPELIQRITIKKEVGLINTADLIIPERNEAGYLKNYGHGGVVHDDLFTIAGRANHLLKIITGENFGDVSMYASEADLEKLQGRWAYWLLKLQPK